jgi:redox-sensitive bicupin YhaK (pirin superfamily)
MIKRLAATMSVIDSLTKSTSIMKTISVTNSKKVFPTGDPNFSVKQAFPANLDHSDIDPFLMLDHFGPKVSTGVETHPDSFPVDWHPHRGMDIMTYLVQGVGRHADSLGNRGSYATPGMQWISVGSGIEHAEGGGDPEGVYICLLFPLFC